ncbi:hypothetical protein KB976_004418 [Vibrio parahaemolyticus]|nr:hypothetical protein [Vibrio parahaemolyticus]
MNEIHTEMINNSLSEFYSDLSAGKKYAFCVRKHFKTFQMLINDGYTIKTISQVIYPHCEITYGTLRDAILKAKKYHHPEASSLKEGKNKSIEERKIEQFDVDDNKNIININKYTNEEWFKAWGFELSKGLTPIMIEELMKYGWTPHNYHKLKDKHNLFNSKRLIHISSDMKRHRATSKDYQ